MASKVIKEDTPLSVDEKNEIYANIQKLISDAQVMLQKEDDKIDASVRKQINNLIKIGEDTVSALDFTNPLNPGATAAEGKEPVWIALKNLYDKANKDGVDSLFDKPPEPPFDFCIQSLAQVMAAKGTAFSSSFLSDLQAVTSDEIITAIDNKFPGYKDWYQDIDTKLNNSLNEALSSLENIAAERKSLFQQATQWSQWNTSLGAEIAKFKQTSKEDLAEWLSGTDVKKDPNYQLYKGLVEGGSEVLERCYANNPTLKDFRKVMTDTEEVVKAYTDGLYEQISNLNDYSKNIEQQLTNLIKTVRDYDPHTLVNQAVSKVQDCHGCVSAWLAWKTDDTGKLKQPVCNVDWCTPELDGWRNK